MLNWFKKDPYDQGFEDAKAVYTFLCEQRPPYEAFKTVSAQVRLFIDEKLKPEREIEGWTGFLVKIAQSWVQIPVNTPVIDAVPMLQFAGGVTQPEKPSADGWEMAMNLYDELTNLDDFLPRDAINYIHSNRQTLYAKLSCGEKLRFKQALNNIESKFPFLEKMSLIQGKVPDKYPVIEGV